MTTTLAPGVNYQRNPNLIATDMDGETVMMSIENSEYYGVGGAGSRIWELLESPVSLEQIVKTLCVEFKVDETTCQNDVVRFIGELQSHGLVSLAAN